jgi:gas vesicle protein
MLLGSVLGFVIGVLAGWLGAPLAGKELRAKAVTPSGRRSLADALKRRNQTLADARRNVQHQAGEAADTVAATAARMRNSAEEARSQAAEAVSRVAEKEQSIVERIKQRLNEARDAASHGYDEGVAEAEQLYDDVRKGRDLE